MPLPWLTSHFNEITYRPSRLNGYVFYFNKKPGRKTRV